MNALRELPKSNLVQEGVKSYRDVTLKFFSGFAAGKVAPQLMLVYDGAFVSCKLDPDRTLVQIAQKLAQQLVDSGNS
jgi:hypothetical protein